MHNRGPISWIFSATAVALSICSLAIGQSPASVRSLRFMAGESGTIPMDANARLISVEASQTDPPLDFPIRVGVAVESAGPRLHLTIPPATPPGSYRVVIDGTRENGEQRSLSVDLTVDAVTFPRSASGRTPVVLLNGFQLICTDTASTIAASQDTFGQLASLLQAEQVPVVFFNNCTYGDISIEQLAAQFTGYIAGLRYADGTPVTQVDLVAHSMGGLISRAYLAGLQPNQTFAPPASPPVRKVVFIATPHFGSFQAPPIGVQTSEMVLGSNFLWDLAMWNQRLDDLRGVDALAVIGNAGTHYTPGGLDDGVVSLSSGSLNFVEPDQRTRVVPYCHVTPTFLTMLGMNCSNHQGIADINDPSHSTARIVRSFLADTADWTTIGHPPSQDPWLSQYGGIFFGEQNSQAQWISDFSQVSFGTVPLTNGGASGTVFYSEFIKGTGTFTAKSASLGSLTCGPFTQPLGYYATLRCKSAPVISAVGPLVSNAAGRVVQSGATIIISGSGLGQQCDTCVVFAYPGPTKLQVSTWNDQAISAILPASYSGFVQVQVQAAAGSDSINIMAASPNAIAVSSVTNSASGAPGAIAPGEIVAIKGTGLGPATGVSFSVNPSTGLVDSTLGGTRVFFGPYAAPITYASATQINAIVPYEIAGQSEVTMQVSFAGNLSAGTPVQVASAAPGAFTFNATGTGQAIAANADGTFNGPSKPAPKGSYVTIYFTGGGQTIPAGTTGSVTGLVLKWLAENIAVTVGNQPAMVQFDGAAPTFVDGVNQLNIQLAANTPSGPAQALVITVGGLSSPATATIAVQ